MKVDLSALAAPLAVGSGGVVVLVVDSLLPSSVLRAARRWVAAGISLAAMALAGWFVGRAGTPGETLGGAYVLDSFSLYLQGFFLVAGAVVVLVSLGGLGDETPPGEFFFLLLTSLTGMLTVPASRDLLLLFIAVETASAPAFVLAGLERKDARSAEASLKFFLVGVVSAAIMLFGMSWLYGWAGSTGLAEIARAVGARPRDPFLLAALFFVMVGFGFKVSAVPFHFWAPDTYEGAPVPVAAFLSVASKTAGFAGLAVLCFFAFQAAAGFWAPLVAAASVVTMSLGNVVALWQRNVVRMLAYSSIAQAGYMLLPLALVGRGEATDGQALSALLLYVAIYAAANLGAFAVVSAVKRQEGGVFFSDFSGLGRRSPFLGVAMTAFLVSLAGIPPLAGFFGKLLIFLVAIRSGAVWLAVVMVLNSVVSIFYYVAVAKEMWLPEPAGGAFRLSPSLALAVSAAALVVMGLVLWPDALLALPPSAVLASP